MEVGRSFCGPLIERKFKGYLLRDISKLSWLLFCQNPWCIAYRSGFANRSRNTSLRLELHIYVGKMVNFIVF